MDPEFINVVSAIVLVLGVVVIVCDYVLLARDARRMPRRRSWSRDAAAPHGRRAAPRRRARAWKRRVDVGVP